jgi:hypothetical protein
MLRQNHRRKQLAGPFFNHMLCPAPALPLLQHLRVGINQENHKKQLAAASSANRMLVTRQDIELQVTGLQLKHAASPICLCYLAKCTVTPRQVM